MDGELAGPEHVASSHADAVAAIEYERGRRRSRSFVYATRWSRFHALRSRVRRDGASSIAIRSIPQALQGDVSGVLVAVRVDPDDGEPARAGEAQSPHVRNSTAETAAAPAAAPGRDLLVDVSRHDRRLG
jgi:hypothetical protein